MPVRPFVALNEKKYALILALILIESNKLLLKSTVDIFMFGGGSKFKVLNCKTCNEYHACKLSANICKS